MAVTTAWSPPRTWARPGCGRSSSSGARRSAARRSRPSSRPGSGCRPWPTPSGGSGRRSSATSTSSATGCRWSGPTCASSRRASTATAIVLWGDAGPDRRGPAHDDRPPTPAATPAFDRLVRSLAGFLGEIAGQTPPDIESPGLGDALAGLKLGRTFRGLGRHDGRTITRVLPMAVADFVAESFETDALRGRDRLARRPVHRDGPVVGRARPRCCSATRPATTGERPARRSSRGAGRARWSRRSSRRRARPASRSGPVPRSWRSPRATAGRPACVLADGDELSARAVVAGIDPKRTLTKLADPVAIGPSLLWRAGNIRTPGTVVEGQSRAVGAAARSPPPAAIARLLRGRIVIAPGIDAMERAHDDAKYGRLSEHADHGGHDPVAGRPHARRRGAPTGRQVMSVIVGATPHTPAGRIVGRAARDARRPGRRGARRPTRPAWRRSSPRARSSPRSTSSATTA